MKKIILGLAALCMVFAFSSCNLAKALTITNGTNQTIIVQLQNDGSSVLDVQLEAGKSIAKAGNEVPTFTKVVAAPAGGSSGSWDNESSSKKVFTITFSGIYTDSSGNKYIQNCKIDAL